MKPLMAKSGGYSDNRRCARVLFWRKGTGEYECHVARSARNDNYLRSLVQFMQHKVPSP
jgi:hypothetical protein